MHFEGEQTDFEPGPDTGRGNARRFSGPGSSTPWICVGKVWGQMEARLCVTILENSDIPAQTTNPERADQAIRVLVHPYYYHKAVGLLQGTPLEA